MHVYQLFSFNYCYFNGKYFRVNTKLITVNTSERALKVNEFYSNSKFFRVEGNNETLNIEYFYLLNWCPKVNFHDSYHIQITICNRSELIKHSNIQL